MNTLYILNEENQPIPVAWQDYNTWEDAIPEEHRTALGKRLETTHLGQITVTTVFMATPIGFHGRKPQLWLTLTIGPGLWKERRYSSHRAALSGHAHAVKEANSPQPPAIAS